MKKKVRGSGGGVGWGGVGGKVNVDVKFIMQTCPCNEHPLTPHFFIVKLGFTGVYTIFLFLF